MPIATDWALMAKVREVRLVGLIPVATAPETMLIPKELVLMFFELVLITALLETICMVTEVKSATSCAISALNPLELTLMLLELVLMLAELVLMRIAKQAILFAPVMPVAALRDAIASWFCTMLVWLVTTWKLTVPRLAWLILVLLMLDESPKELTLMAFELLEMAAVREVKPVKLDPAPAVMVEMFLLV